MSLAYACDLSWNPLCQLEGYTLNFLRMYLVVIVCSPDRHQKVRLMMCLSLYSCAFILMANSCIKYFPVDLCFHNPRSVLQFQFSTCRELLKSAAVCNGFKLLMHRSYKRSGDLFINCVHILFLLTFCNKITPWKMLNPEHSSKCLWKKVFYLGAQLRLWLLLWPPCFSTLFCAVSVGLLLDKLE
jgi:hypothetical protein